MNLTKDHPKFVKSDQEIELMKISGKICAQVLKKVLENVKVGVTCFTLDKIANRIGDISATIQQGVESAGYSIVKSLTGHGIGHELHEEPMVPGFGKVGTGPKIRQNMVLAIEVIYTQGLGEVKLEKDNWTISSVDGSLAGLFEQTVLITGNGPIVLTPYL